MADSAVKRTEAHRAYRAWLTSFVVASGLMVGAGLALAGAEPGVARPWSGLALLVALGLAMVVGASKTSSA